MRSDAQHKKKKTIQIEYLTWHYIISNHFESYVCDERFGKANQGLHNLAVKFLITTRSSKTRIRPILIYTIENMMPNCPSSNIRRLNTHYGNPFVSSPRLVQSCRYITFHSFVLHKRLGP